MMAEFVRYSSKLALAVISIAIILGNCNGQNHSAGDRIIHDIASHERLYENLYVDFTWHFRFDKNANSGRILDTFVDESERHIKAWYEIPLMREEMNSRSLSVTGNSVSNTGLVSYDGTRSVIINNELVNIHNERVALPLQFRPHRTILEVVFRGMNLPLSDFLRGGAGVSGNTMSGLYGEKGTFEVRYEGSSKESDLNCEKFSAVWTRNTPRRDEIKAVLWLARDRNYIPQRLEIYSLLFSRTTPCAVGVAENWKEVSPGIWLPFKVKHQEFHTTRIQAGERNILPYNTETLMINNIIYGDKYIKNIYSKYTLPVKGAYYEFRNGMVIKSYIIGKETPLNIASKISTTALLTISIIVVFSILAYMLYKRYKRRSDPEPI